MRFGFFAAALASMFFCQTLSHADVRTDVSPGVGESPDTVRPMTFFQLNIWEGLGNIDNGLDVFKDQLLALMPDVASFCEFPSQGDEKVEEASAEYILGQTIDYIFKKTGVRYYKTSMSGRGTRGVLTRHPVVEGAAAVASTSAPGQQQGSIGLCLISMVVKLPCTHPIPSIITMPAIFQGAMVTVPIPMAGTSWLAARSPMWTGSSRGMSAETGFRWPWILTMT